MFSLFSRLTEKLLGPMKSKSMIRVRELTPLCIDGLNSNVNVRDANEAIIFRGADQKRSVRFDCPIKKVVGGIDHIMFLLHDGRIYGIGSNSFGQLGVDVNMPFSLWS